MTVSLHDVIASMDPARREAIEAAVQQRAREIDSLRALRLLAEKSQEQLAQALGVKQPAIHKIEKQTDLYLSTLRRFVEAAGGKLELRVELPGHETLTLTGIGDFE